MSYSHLTTFERGRIDSFLKLGWSARKIAKFLNRHHSTISRELRRNNTNLYSAEIAQTDYQFRRQKCKPKGKFNEDLKNEIETKLKETWSPEQIAATLPAKDISFKTIYNWLYQDRLIKGDLSCLRQKGKRRKPREKRGRYNVGKSIHDRPVEIDNRKTFGHWELDTVVSSRGKSKGCFATFLERKSRLYLAVKMPDRTAASMEEAIQVIASALPRGAIKSFTVDRGKEFTCYETIESSLGVPVYFADPYSSWQRGANENANGLLREFFPKASDLAIVTDFELKAALKAIMKRPRKVLFWKTAYEVFMEEMAHLA